MQITYHPKWNFHNAQPINLRVSRIEEDHGHRKAYISKAQARRLAKHFCGITDCRCNSGGLIPENEEGTEFSIELPY